ncbi:hypothetical protein HJC23_005832 [Cyclotella cryptica]|uniref:Phosphomannomutase n=1 Tax=Cyclotella cryptica TaxID=29204 RepID=A0ABD3QZB3_9STRA|eukprot:CCRYP_000330-RA/>CCRYP_000330-RA protein AED:0.25 eAED:0.25 QI:150/1/1/1/0.75/0.6/5/1096/633
MGFNHRKTAFLFAAFCTSSSSAFVHWPIITQHIYIIRSQFTGILRASPSPIEASTSPVKNASSFKIHIGNPTEIDSSNTPPNLQLILTSLAELKSGSDLRGTYVDHKHSGGTIANVSHLIKMRKNEEKGAALTPFASHCFGVAFGKKLLQDGGIQKEGGVSICLGRDPRPHGERLADAFARGAESVDGVRVLYTGLASTPSMYEFCRADKCDAAVMVTASHLPEDKNGFKFFGKGGGFTKSDIDELIVLAQTEARHWYDMGILPPSSGISGVLCSELVDFMPFYIESLKQAVHREVGTSDPYPLSNLKIVVNPGKGSGCFFNELLRDLGANVDHSLHLHPDGTFPTSSGVPNPENKVFVEETLRACEECNADIGVMFDTDADRAGFVLPRVMNENGRWLGYEALNRNRLIALLSVIFSTSAPGCTIVTDSTTSEGLNTFLENTLGLKHFRYLRGYANVIGKAKELTESGEANAEIAIETSGHCAMKENGYTDDGTYTAVKIIGLLARTSASGQGSLLDLISGLTEMPFDEEYRIKIKDGSLETTTFVFQKVTEALKERCSTESEWILDEDNLEGIRMRLASGGFFMLRQSLHDPVISMQIESISDDEARKLVLEPLLQLFSEHESVLDLSALR